MTIAMPLTWKNFTDTGQAKISWRTKLTTFVKEAAVAAKNKIISFVTGFYQHAESIAVLTLSSFGLSALLGELPFWVALPWWIEGPMVIPVLSVIIIWALVTIGEKRALRRAAI